MKKYYILLSICLGLAFVYQLGNDSANERAIVASVPTNNGTYNNELLIGLSDKLSQLNRELVLLKEGQALQAARLEQKEQLLDKKLQELDRRIMVLGDNRQFIQEQKLDDDTKIHATVSSRLTPDQRFDSLVDSVFAEDVDSAWSENVSLTIESVLSSGEVDGSSLTNLQCASTKCYLEVTHKNEKSSEQFSSNFISSSQFANKYAFEIKSNGLSQQIVLIDAKNMVIDPPEGFLSN